MIQDNNPFQGFISISENLFENQLQETEKWLKKYDKNRKLYYFIASGTYDSPDRIKSGYQLENVFKNLNNSNILFENKMYQADHNNLVAKSLLDGLMFIFQDYRNLTAYENGEIFIKNYPYDMLQNYGIKSEISYIEVDYFISPILDKKDAFLLENFIQICETNNINAGNSLDKANMFYFIEEYEKSLFYWNLTVEKFENIEPLVFYYNFEKAIEAFLKLKKANEALTFLEKAKNKIPDFFLEFSYFSAKVAIENNLNKKTANQNLNFCFENFKENLFFTKKELNELKLKLK
jgi:hypothetical protein